MYQKRRTVIHCGATRVSRLGFHNRENGRIVVEEAATAALDPECYVDGEKWMQSFRRHLEYILPVRSSRLPATVILPGFSILAKTVIIPHVDAYMRREVVAYEAGLMLPCSMDSLWWDYHEIEDDGVEGVVLFMAVKRDWFADFYHQLTGAGLKPDRVTGGPGLDLEAMNLIAPGERRPHLLVDVGARTTGITYIRDGGFSCRLLQWGGNQLTRSLAAELKADFTTAERLKTRIFEEEYDAETAAPEVQTVYAHAESFMKRLCLEIENMLAPFRVQEDAMPASILMTGGASRLPGLPRFLSSRLQLPVRLLDPDAGVHCGPAVGAATWRNLQIRVMEGIGEAALLDNPDGIKLELRPPAMRPTSKTRKTAYFVSVLLLAVTAFIPWMRCRLQAPLSDRNREALENVLAAEVALAGHYLSVQERMKKRQLALQSLDLALSPGSHWPGFFQELQDNLSATGDVWLDALTVTRSSSETDIPGAGSGGDPLPTRVDGAPECRLTLSGKMLLREQTEAGYVMMVDGYDENLITKRIRRLTDQLNASPYIKRSEAPAIYWTRLEDGILPFRIQLIVNPDRRL